MPLRPLSSPAGVARVQDRRGSRLVLGFLSTLLLVCLLGGADLRNMPQARWEGIE